MLKDHHLYTTKTKITVISVVGKKKIPLYLFEVNTSSAIALR